MMKIRIRKDGACASSLWLGEGEQFLLSRGEPTEVPDELARKALKQHAAFLEEVKAPKKKKEG
jgi:hypothetical protein